MYWRMLFGAIGITEIDYGKSLFSVFLMAVIINNSITRQE